MPTERATLPSQAGWFKDTSVKILFCTPAPLTKSLGAAKVVVELAEEMQTLGWECDLVSIKDMAAKSGLSLSESLRRHLQEHAGEYDVVDYDHEYLPYSRSEFSLKPLFVARSVLLVHHLETIPIPIGIGLRSQIGHLLKGPSRRKARRERVQRAQATVAGADFINVSNHDDKAELVQRGISPDKIVVIPYGISRTRRILFDQVSSEPPKQPVVAFVGTFDYRKGAREFPKIVASVAEAVPGVRFKLLGTKGLFLTEAAVRSHFPKRLQQALEVIPAYQPEELPQHLASCSIGIFPSYMEGMPFGVLEMMASSLPVIAYDAPGLPMLLPPEYLVTRGDWQSLSRRVVTLLQGKNSLEAERITAKQLSHVYSWEATGKMTHTFYLQNHHEALRV